MEQPVDFKFELEYMSVVTTLVSNPIEWKEYTTEWSRHKTYLGFFRGWVDSMTFVKEGAKILQKAYSTRGVEASVTVRVYRLDRSTYTYSLDFVGDVDFSTIQFTDKDGSVNVNIKQGGVMQLLEAYADVEYDIPVSPERTVTTDAGSLKFTENATLAIVYEYNMENINHLGMRFVPTKKVHGFNFTDDYEFPQISDYDIIDESTTPASFFPTFTKKTNSPSVIAFTTHISKSVNDKIIFKMPKTQGYDHTATCRLAFGLFDYERPADTIILGYSNELSAAEVPIENNVYTLAFTVDTIGATLINSGKYLLRFEMQLLLPTGWTSQAIAQFAWQTGSLLMTFETFMPSFSFNAIRVIDALQLILSSMGINSTPISNFLSSTDASKLWITSGNAIRGFDSPKIRITFSELFKSLHAIYGICLSVANEQIILEDMQYFFNVAYKMLIIQNVTDVGIEADKTRLFTSLKIGYEDNTYDEINGVDEFNTELAFTLPITKVGDKDGETLDLVSGVRADCYGIAYTWFKRNAASQNNTDYSTDNKTFFVVVDSGAGYNVNVDKSINVLQGSLSPTGVFNVAISPMHNLRRWFSYIKGICDKQNDKYIKFTSIAKPKSALVSEDVDGTVITEQSDMLVGDIQTRMFSPNLLKFTTPVPYNLPALLGNSPNGFIEVIISDTLMLTGFIEEISENPTNRNAQNWTLLLHPSTPDNILELINKNS